MKKNPYMIFGILILAFIAIFVFIVGSSVISLFSHDDEPVKVEAKNSILKMELNGVILDSKKFVKTLNRYKKDNHIKAIVVGINSPGGVVGPSQEIYEELRRVRTETKKPVVADTNGLMASGAMYAAVAADKIVVAPGAMVGSIGVIMEFINLEKLYDWAKVSRYSITTGKYKDSGAEYRSMRDDEKALFQDLVNEVYGQFVSAVAQGRNLKEEMVREFADGRVFTGSIAVKLGFADEVGTISDAYRLAAKMAGLDPEKYEIFEIPKHRPSIMDFISAQQEEDDATTKVDKVVNSLLRTELANKPLYLLPGYYR